MTGSELEAWRSRPRDHRLYQPEAGASRLIITQARSADAGRPLAARLRSRRSRQLRLTRRRLRTPGTVHWQAAAPDSSPVTVSQPGPAVRPGADSSGTAAGRPAA